MLHEKNGSATPITTCSECVSRVVLYHYIVLADSPNISILRNFSTLARLENGSSTRMCFTWTGCPPPSVSIQKSGSSVPLDEYSRLKLVNSCVEITAARREDRGSYTVKAENCLGSATVKFRLKVLSNNECYRCIKPLCNSDRGVTFLQQNQAY